MVQMCQWVISRVLMSLLSGRIFKALSLTAKSKTIKITKAQV
jgi:hypothetical protein